MSLSEPNVLPESNVWQICLEKLQSKIAPEQFNTWIRSLKAESEGTDLRLVARNRFVFDWVAEHFMEDIKAALGEIKQAEGLRVALVVASAPSSTNQTSDLVAESTTEMAQAIDLAKPSQFGQDLLPSTKRADSHLNPAFGFDTFVQGHSNQLAWAASHQVASNPGLAYNPLFIYGGVGLGKTHLMHAIGNMILVNNPSANVLYLHSERFVADMVKALQNNTINEFKRFYRSLNLLLIDDIQFFVGKDRSQEEFFHTFNFLLEGQQQIVLTSDRYPKDIDGLPERLRSRFGWGLTVAVEPPELEHRIAILMLKAKQANIELPEEVTFFIAKRIRSNVRELEGAFRRVVANAQFTGRKISIEFAQEALRDLLALQEKLVTIENIQKTVAEYYKVKVSDLLSKRRNRSVTRPRQLAMLLAKELTNHSLPEIGEAFGGRDHTTVIHAYRKMQEWIKSQSDLAEDYKNLIRILTA